MLNQETGPLPLPADGIEDNRRHLRYLKTTNSGSFNEFGIFVVSSNDNKTSICSLALTEDGRVDERGGAPYWSQILLGFSPDDYRLRFKTNPLRLQVVGVETQKVAQRIPIRDVRYVHSGGVEVVGESGCLLDPRIHSDISRKDRILAAADQGVRPERFDNSLLVKLLEPDLAGERVLYLDLHYFDHKGGETKLVEDGVVIDMKTKKLLRRSFEHPLSYARWGEPFIPGIRGRGSLTKTPMPTKSYL